MQKKLLWKFTHVVEEVKKQQVNTKKVFKIKFIKMKSKLLSIAAIFATTTILFSSCSKLDDNEPSFISDSNTSSNRETTQCHGITSDGTRCERNVDNSKTTFCWEHNDQK